MTATTNVQLGRATLGHLAIHYRPGDFAACRRLFEAMGAHLEDNGPEGFCTIVFDREDWNFVDNVLYLGQATAVKLALDAAVTEALHIGEADEDPRASAFREHAVVVTGVARPRRHPVLELGVARTRGRRADRADRSRRRARRSCRPSRSTAPAPGSTRTSTT